MGRGIFLLCLWSGASAWGIQNPTALCKEDLLFPSFSDSQFLKDVARYLTGSEAGAEAIYKQYRNRANQLKPTVLNAGQVPQKLEVFLDQIQFTSQVWESPLSSKWERSQSKQWLRKEIPHSRVNGKKRIFYRSTPRLDQPLVWIAQSGEPGTLEFETEVSVRREKSADWDFFSYDSTGTLASESVFLTQNGTKVIGSVPLTCLACHYDRSHRRFTPMVTLGGRLKDF